MNGKGRLMKWLDECTHLTDETLPGVPVVEIAGTGRVLVERHLGVRAYSRERIEVQLCYGILCICGCNLSLSRMTQGQLVISGEINHLQICRRCS